MDSAEARQAKVADKLGELGDERIRKFAKDLEGLPSLEFDEVENKGEKAHLSDFRKSASGDLKALLARAQAAEARAQK